MEETATVTIPTAGNWTFGTSSDDGSQLSVGPLSLTDDGIHADTDAFATYNFPSAGVYPLSLLYFQGPGGAEVEVFAAQGSFGSFNSNFELVGDTTDGGLAEGVASGSITETGGVVSTTGTLTTVAGAGTALNGANTVGTFNATNSSGNVSLNNTAAAFTVSGISETGGTATVHNTGSDQTSSTGTGITSTGNIVDTTTANLTVSRSRGGFNGWLDQSVVRLEQLCR